MTRPNLTPEEVKGLIFNCLANVDAAMLNYVKQGRLSRDDADSYVLKATVAHHDSVKVIAIRGYFKKSVGDPNKNDRNVYDDAIILIGPNYFKTFNGNTDPRQYKQGIAMLLPGWHLFKKGVHHPGKSGQHEAFRTANAREVLPVLRDGQVGIKEGVTINMHKGGINSTNSAGCQTIHPDQWLEFQRDAYKLLTNEGQRVLPYLLLENL